MGVFGPKTPIFLHTPKQIHDKLTVRGVVIDGYFRVRLTVKYLLLFFDASLSIRKHRDIRGDVDYKWGKSGFCK